MHTRTLMHSTHTPGSRRQGKLTTFLAWALVAALGVGGALSGCGPTKKGPAARAYHSFVSLFNGYYHAELCYRDAVRQIDQGFSLQEDQFITIMNTDLGATTTTSNPLFDQAIEKCDVIIFRHRNGGFMDETHYLKGRCYFYKQDVAFALQNFQYVVNEHPKTKSAVRARVWIAMCYLQLKNNSMLQKELQPLVDTLPLIKDKKLKGEVALFIATVRVKEKNFQAAIDVLEPNLKAFKGRLTKARLHYLLAQLYDQLGNFTKAYEHYDKVYGLDATNQLNFNAQLNKAQLFIKYQPQNADPAAVTATLAKMLKEAKYDEYHDQIYHQFGLLALKNDQVETALAAFKKGVATSKGNVRVKTLNYFKLGETYFYNKLILDSAQAYFDSAAAIVPKNFVDYDRIQTISQTLKVYAQAKNTVHLQDSLLKLSTLSDTALSKYVDEYIKKEEEIKKQTELKLQQQNNPNPFGLNNNMTQTTPVTGFYFDNPTLVSNGRLTFSQTWGERKLEDNWRRKNKEVVFADNDPNNASNGGGPNLNDLKARKEQYIKNVPRTPEDIKASHDKIQTALLDLGQLFDQKLSMPDSAIKAYQIYLKRYPDGPEAPRVLYALHMLCKKINHPDAESYAKQLTTRFPGSNYTKLLTQGPEAESGNAEFNSAYNMLYALYEKGDFNTVVSFTGFMIAKYAAHPDLPRLYYLRGLSYGELKTMDSLVANFQRIVSNFPGADVAKPAKATLDLLKAPPTGANPGTTDPKPNTPATTDPANKPPGSDDPRFAGFFVDRINNEPVIGIVLVDKSKVDKNALQVAIADFNSQFFKSDNLNVTVLIYKNQYHLVYITQYANYLIADKYIEALKKHDKLKPWLADANKDVFFLSSNNFRTAFSMKRFDDYILYHTTYRDQMLANDK